MKSRMSNPVMIVPEAMKALQALGASAEKGGAVPARTIGLVQLRASQINGCGICCDMHPRIMKKAGETDERLFAVAAWRDTPYFDDAERAALALTEAVTRLSDRADPVPDEVWEDARPALRRAGPGRAAHRDRHDQRLEPPQRGDAAGGGLGAVGAERRRARGEERAGGPGASDRRDPVHPEGARPGAEAGPGRRARRLARGEPVRRGGARRAGGGRRGHRRDLAAPGPPGRPEGPSAFGPEPAADRRLCHPVPGPAEPAGPPSGHRAAGLPAGGSASVPWRPWTARRSSTSSPCSPVPRDF